MSEIVSVGGNCQGIGEFETGEGCIIEEEGLVGQDCEDEYTVCLPFQYWPTSSCTFTITQKLYVCDELVQTVEIEFELVTETTGPDTTCSVEHPPRIAGPPIPPPTCGFPAPKTRQLNVDARKRPQEGTSASSGGGLGPDEVTSFDIPVGTEFGDSLYLFRFAFIPEGWSYTISDSDWIYTPDTIHVEVTHDDMISEEDTARVVLYAYSGEEEFAGYAEVMVYDPGPVTSVDPSPEAELPGTYELAQNYPNPFNSRTNIEFGLPRASDVTIDVINILGQRVVQLVDDRLPAGRYRLEWNGVDLAGNAVATGVYFYRIRAGAFIETRRMLLLK
jgi:hypothetical protein